eukprot:2449610-Amphidinium_carterae.1
MMEYPRSLTDSRDCILLSRIPRTIGGAQKGDSLRSSDLMCAKGGTLMRDCRSSGPDRLVHAK